MFFRYVVLWVGCVWFIVYVFVAVAVSAFFLLCSFVVWFYLFSLCVFLLSVMLNLFLGCGCVSIYMPGVSFCVCFIRVWCDFVCDLCCVVCYWLLLLFF